MNNKAIGVFDSGLGGLTVLKELQIAMPNEKIIYFGDSKRAPYGTKSKENILNFSFQDIEFLLSKGVKAIVIACNTVSSNAISEIKEKYKIPIIEVINPGAKAGISATKNKKVGVIGTRATIESNAYKKEINKYNEEIEVFSKSCTLFVPLVEEGEKWWSSSITKEIVSVYLEELVEKDIDTLLLGCTHYPLLKSIIKEVVGSKVSLIDSAKSVALETKKVIEELNLQSDFKEGSVELYTSDSVEKFMKLATLIMDNKTLKVFNVDIEGY